PSSSASRSKRASRSARVHRDGAAPRAIFLRIRARPFRNVWSKGQRWQRALQCRARRALSNASSGGALALLQPHSKNVEVEAQKEPEGEARRCPKNHGWEVLFLEQAEEH